MEAEGGGQPELVGLIAAAVVLLVAFGSLVASACPSPSRCRAGHLHRPHRRRSGSVDVPEWAPAVSALIGIGVGIDYALLILTRFRGALADGLDVRHGIVEAVTTAGRSVLIAGGTVVISLLGLFLMGVSYMNGVAVAAIIAVLVVMAASVTLLPSLLAFAGRRVDRLRIPGLGTDAPERPPGARRALGAGRAAPPTGGGDRRAGCPPGAGRARPRAAARFPDAGNRSTDSIPARRTTSSARASARAPTAPCWSPVDLARPGSAADLGELERRLRAEEASPSSPRHGSAPPATRRSSRSSRDLAPGRGHPGPGYRLRATCPPNRRRARGR